MPNVLGDSENYVMANPMQTPPAIVPEWYLLPFYAILRSIPNKLLGVIAMFSAIIALLVLPFSDLSKWRGIQFRPLSKIVFYTFLANFLILMQLGAKHVESPFIEIGQIATVWYFLHFVGTVPSVSLLENSLMDLAIKAGWRKKVTISGKKKNMVSKRFFSTSKSLKAEPTALMVIGAFSPVPPAFYIPYLTVIGIGGFLYSMWFTEFSALNMSFADQMALTENYMEVVNFFSSQDYSDTGNEMLREVLIAFERVIVMNEIIFDRSAAMVNHLERIESPFYDAFNLLFENWREMGNDLMDQYREIEGILGITPSQSRFPETWFEN